MAATNKPSGADAANLPAWKQRLTQRRQTDAEKAARDAAVDACEKELAEALEKFLVAEFSAIKELYLKAVGTGGDWKLLLRRQDEDSGGLLNFHSDKPCDCLYLWRSSASDVDAARDMETKSRNFLGFVRQADLARQFGSAEQLIAFITSQLDLVSNKLQK